MEQPGLDVIVADDGLASLAAGYLLASAGRSVGVIGHPPPSGTTAVSVVATGRLEPLRALVDAAPVIGQRSAVVLQPEGGLRVEMTSDRYRDAAHAVAIVDRAAVAIALLDAMLDIGATTLSATSMPVLASTGAVVGVDEPVVGRRAARCTILSPVEADRLFGLPPQVPASPPAIVEVEWCFRLDADAVTARFTLGDGDAAEWWLYGDPFDGAGAIGRLRAFGDRLTMTALLPLTDVLDHEVVVADLCERLRVHPFIAPLVGGAEPEGVAANTVQVGAAPSAAVGDGWVEGPQARPASVAPLTGDIESGEAMARAIHLALASPTVTAARLSPLVRSLRDVANSSARIPPGPIATWADDLVVGPGGLVEGLRLLAGRFSAAR